MWLGRNGIEVDDARPDIGHGWSEAVARYEAVVLDVGNVEVAEQGLEVMMQLVDRPPVLLVGPQTPEWLGLAGRFSDHLTFLALPLMLAVVVEELTRLSREDALTTVTGRPTASGAIDQVLLSTPLVEGEDRAPSPDINSSTKRAIQPEPPDEPLTEAPPGDAGPAGQETDPIGASGLRSRPPTGGSKSKEASKSPLGSRQRRPARAPQRDARNAKEAGAQFLDRNAPAVSDLRFSIDNNTGSARDRLELEDEPHSSLVRLLGEVQAHLYKLNTVREVADFALTEMIECSQGSAGVALMQAQQGWAVEAGMGLRPLEMRLVVPTDHWLIRQAVTQELGVLLTRSDSPGMEFAGVPLGTWEHIAAVYLPKGCVLVLLASAHRPFSVKDIKRVRDFDPEVEALLREAYAVRELARALRPFDEDYST